MRAGEGFIICYSITDRRSFHEVREFKQLIYRVRRTDDTPVVLVGNKSDLTQLRQVKAVGSPPSGAVPAGKCCETTGFSAFLHVLSCCLCDESGAGFTWNVMKNL